MAVIYEPKGRAREYSPLAVNLYDGCMHSCKYCYAPGVVHKKRSIFHEVAKPRKDILKRLKADCEKIAKECPKLSQRKEILLCFTCDPYPPEGNDLTREALEILSFYKMRVQILTKGAWRAARDFDLMRKNRWKFGSTIILTQSREQWEPNAPGSLDRLLAIEEAHARGIYTWVSVEPVIVPAEAVEVLKMLVSRGTVNEVRIGKVNYHKHIEDKVDWKKFLEKAESIVNGHCSVYIKKDLLAAAGRDDG